MVALEAIREALVLLDKDISDLEECIEGNSDHIGDNYELINVNDHLIIETDTIIETQQKRLEALQWRCRNS